MAKTVTVYFATNRQPLIKDGDRIVGFTSELGPVGGLDVRYGQALVKVDITRRTARMVPDSLEVAEQKLLFAVGGSPILGSKTIFDALRENMKDDERVTIAFIHGFSNSFTDSIERAGWILAFYGMDANIFVFS